jgi:hypothetical protein
MAALGARRHGKRRQAAALQDRSAPRLRADNAKRRGVRNEVPLSPLSSVIGGKRRQAAALQNRSAPRLRADNAKRRGVRNEVPLSPDSSVICGKRRQAAALQNRSAPRLRAGNAKRPGVRNEVPLSPDCSVICVHLCPPVAQFIACGLPRQALSVVLFPRIAHFWQNFPNRLSK